MGAAIALAIARAGRCPLDRLVLSSPMIALAGMKWPRAARGFVEALDAVGLGGAFSRRGGSKIVATLPYENNPLTSDPVRYARTASIVAANPELSLGYPTIGWLDAAFRLMREFEDPEFPRRTLTPTLVIAAGADRVVDTRAAERFASRLRAGRMIIVEGAEHELLVERDVFRDQFFAAFDAFIPGVEGVEREPLRELRQTRSPASRKAEAAGRSRSSPSSRWRGSPSPPLSAPDTTKSYTIVVARRLDLSYFDHPPLHQWIAHFAALILGEGTARGCRSSRCSPRPAG